MPTSSRLPTRPRSRHAACGGLGDAAENLEQRALAGSIASDDANHLALLHLEAYILQRPEFLDLVALNDLPAVEQIGCLAREIARLASDDVAQRRVALALSGLVTNQVASSTDFRRR